MPRLPAKPNLDHLKTQAKDLLSFYRRGDSGAIARFRNALPQARGKDDPAIAALGLRLHDAQSCVAREHGFASWADLACAVAARNAASADSATAIRSLLHMIYAGDVAGGENNPQPYAAVRLIEERPELIGGDPYLACSVGDLAVLRGETVRDPAWVNRPGGPLALPPLVAVTHSSLVRLPDWRDRLIAAARFLLDAGADPDQSVPSRWMRSLDSPDDKHPLSALYGAAGQNHDTELTQLLLSRGANPNDGESLYHALDRPAVTRVLLEAGARIEGTIIYHALDLADAEPVRVLLAHGADPNERAPSPPTSDWGSPLLWAIRRRRSLAHIEALLAAGADPSARTPAGTSAYALALQYGLPDVAAILSGAGAEGSQLSLEEEFVAACTQGDDARAERILKKYPGVVQALTPFQLRTLPELAAEGAGDAVRLMVRLGWPVDIPGGDWSASALNHAVLRGDAALAHFLLDHGASWRELHGFCDNVLGTLSYASRNGLTAGGDWVACAEALVAAGLPPARRDAGSPGALLIEGERKWFSEDVTEILLAGRAE